MNVCDCNEFFTPPHFALSDTYDEKHVLIYLRAQAAHFVYGSRKSADLSIWADNKTSFSSDESITYFLLLLGKRFNTLKNRFVQFNQLKTVRVLER